MLVGIPGSGKSTWVHDNIEPNFDTYISRDEIRFSLLNDKQAYFEVEDKVKKIYFKEIEQDTKEDGYTYIDATHLNPKSRAITMSHIDPSNYVIAVSFEVPVQTALLRNSMRVGRARVPDNIIYRMSDSFVIPTLEEGFDEIWHINALGRIRKEIKK